jgi:hypothetical protein
MDPRPEHPGLKIETWGTHSIFVRDISRKHLQEGASTEISALRFASVEE